MSENNDIDIVVKTVASVLALVSFVLVLVGFTDLGQMKTFRFVLGEVTMVTAITYSFQAVSGVNKFTYFGIAIWFSVASISFAQAAWPVVR